MKEWYYGIAEAQHGPVDETELNRLLSTRSIPYSTLVWSEGMTGWTSAALIPELVSSPYAPPSSEIDSDVDWSGYEPSGSQIRPWIRYWARTTDLLLFGLGAGFLLAWLAPEALEIPDSLFGIILLLVNIFVEPAIFAVFGTTPAKALFRVRVRNRDGSKLSYPVALRRTFNVALRGLGFGIPLVSLITNLTSYSRLTNHGITSWDADGGFTVSHQTVDWWRWLVFAALVAGFSGLIYLGALPE